tara:strand:- start:1196 stop:1444 length:249 start_codon:yes stop_codon:yes gene_type:complete
MEGLKEKTTQLEKELNMPGSKIGLLDKMFGKLASRKLTVWITATALMAVTAIDPDSWVTISLVYIGSQSAIDLAVAWRKAGK